MVTSFPKWTMKLKNLQSSIKSKFLNSERSIITHTFFVFEPTLLLHQFTVQRGCIHIPVSTLWMRSLHPDWIMTTWRVCPIFIECGTGYDRKQSNHPSSYTYWRKGFMSGVDNGLVVAFGTNATGRAWRLVALGFGRTKCSKSPLSLKAKLTHCAISPKKWLIVY